jgi:hypothetical protein
LSHFLSRTAGGVTPESIISSCPERCITVYNEPTAPLSIEEHSGRDRDAEHLFQADRLGT